MEMRTKVRALSTCLGFLQTYKIDIFTELRPRNIPPRLQRSPAHSETIVYYIYELDSEYPFQDFTLIYLSKVFLAPNVSTIRTLTALALMHTFCIHAIRNSLKLQACIIPFRIRFIALYLFHWLSKPRPRETLFRRIVLPK
jgi:hypothetical protein